MNKWTINTLDFKLRADIPFNNQNETMSQTSAGDVIIIFSNFSDQKY